MVYQVNTNLGNGFHETRKEKLNIHEQQKP